MLEIYIKNSCKDSLFSRRVFRHLMTHLVTHLATHLLEILVERLLEMFLFFSLDHLASCINHDILLHLVIYLQELLFMTHLLNHVYS